MKQLTHIFFIILILNCQSKQSKSIKINELIYLNISKDTKVDTIQGIDNSIFKLYNLNYGKLIIECGFNISKLNLKETVLVPLDYGAEEMNKLSEYKYYVEVERRKNMNILDPNYYQVSNFKIDSTSFDSPVKWVYPIKQNKGYNGVFFYKIYQSKTMGNYKLKIYTADNNNLSEKKFREFIKEMVIIKDTKD